MRLGLFLLVAMLLLALVAGQNALLSAEAETMASAITTCTVQGGACPQPSLDNAPPVVVLGHTVYVGGCWQKDLHVLRYVPAGSPDGKAVTATWCT